MANFSVSVDGQYAFEKALRRFTSKTRKSGILRELKRRRFYTKLQKALDRARSIRRQKKAERLAQMTSAVFGAAGVGRVAAPPPIWFSV